jgi:hypothetical protein
MILNRKAELHNIKKDRKEVFQTYLKEVGVMELVAAHHNQNFRTNCL